jgi:hypothetical protein
VCGIFGIHFTDIIDRKGNETKVTQQTYTYKSYTNVEEFYLLEYNSM